MNKWFAVVIRHEDQKSKAVELHDYDSKKQANKKLGELSRKYSDETLVVYENKMS